MLEEFELQIELDKSKNIEYRDLISLRFRKRFVIGAMMKFLLVFTGLSAIMSISSAIIENIIGGE